MSDIRAYCVHSFSLLTHPSLFACFAFELSEMGLGKTVQTIGFLRTLYSKGLRGPFLILAPLSCTPHWQREFEAWVDTMHVVRFADHMRSRNIAREYDLAWRKAMGLATPEEKNRLSSSNMRGQLRANVVIASNELFRVDVEFFQRVNWQCVIIDEAHSLRNPESKFYQCLQQCNFMHKVLLTGVRTKQRT